MPPGTRRMPLSQTHSLCWPKRPLIERRYQDGPTTSTAIPALLSLVLRCAAIKVFSKPGELVLDPYMGGATTLVEGLAEGRDVVGNDLNSLAAFIARVKITPLRQPDVKVVKTWLKKVVPHLGFGEWILRPRAFCRRREDAQPVASASKIHQTRDRERIGEHRFFSASSQGFRPLCAASSCSMGSGWSRTRYDSRRLPREGRRMHKSNAGLNRRLLRGA